MRQSHALSRRKSFTAACVAAALLITGCVEAALDTIGRSERHRLTGEAVVADPGGAVVGIVAGVPGMPTSQMTLEQMEASLEMLYALEDGETYPCPRGAGGGYDDLVPGAQVVVADGSGAVIATTKLEGGELTAKGCTFTFSADVTDHDFFQISVTHRGALTYSRADLEEKDWHITSVIG